MTLTTLTPLERELALLRERPSRRVETRTNWLDSVRWCIDYEVLAASPERREPALTANPFHGLSLPGHYRAKSPVDREREEKGKRNPLRPSSTLGPFLEAAWSK